MLHYLSRPPEHPWTSSPSQRSRSRPKWPQTTRTCSRSTQTVLQGGAQRATDASSPSSNTDYIHPVLTLYFMFSSSVIGTPRQGSPRPAAFCKWTTTRRSVEPTGGPSWRICIVPTSSCGRRTHTHLASQSYHEHFLSWSILLWCETTWTIMETPNQTTRVGMTSKTCRGSLYNARGLLVIITTQGIVGYYREYHLLLWSIILSIIMIHTVCWSNVPNHQVINWWEVGTRWLYKKES